MEHSINVRIPASLWAEVRDLAVNERRSATAQLAIVIERGLGGMASRRPANVPARSPEGRKEAKQHQSDNHNTEESDGPPVSDAARRYLARQAHYQRTGEYPPDEQQ